MKKKKSFLWTTAACLMFAAVLFDQWTKYMAALKLKGKEAFLLISGVFELRYLENRGAAFGVFQDGRIFFIPFTVLVLIFLIILINRSFVMGFKTGKRSFYVLCGALTVLCAGAVGNLIDRVLRQYVIDFLYFKLIDFPIFNVADCYVTISIAIIFITILFFVDESSFAEMIRFRKKKPAEERLRMDRAETAAEEEERL